VNQKKNFATDWAPIYTDENEDGESTIENGARREFHPPSSILYPRFCFPSVFIGAPSVAKSAS
jgi:hypothetical protein